MSVRTNIVLGLLLAFGWCQAGHCNKPPQGLTTYYTTEQGLSNNAVFGIHCDREGFLWFFTWNGISRYDGYRFVNYGTAQQQQQLVHNRIASGFEDRHANFWVVTYTHNLYRFERYTEEFEGIDRFLPEGVRPNISQVTEAPDGTVWAVVPDYGIVSLATDPETRRLLPRLYRQGQPAPVGLLYPDAEGLVWFTQQNRLFSISAAEQSLYCELQLDEGVSFSTVQGDGGTIRFGTTDGRLILRDVRTQGFSEHRLPVHEAVSAIAPPSEGEGAGTIFIGTATGLFGCFDGAAFRPLMRCADGIERIIRDSFGLLWIVTNGEGLYSYDPATGKSQRFTEGTDAELAVKINGAVIEHNGETWLRLNGGGMFWYDRATGTAHRFYDLNEATAGAWTSSCFDRQGDLWATTTNRGVVRIRFIDPRVKSLPLHGHRPGRMLYVDRSDRLWSSLRNGGLMRYAPDREHYELFLHDDTGRPLDKIYALVENPDSTCWLGTKNEGLLLAAFRPDGSVGILERHAYAPDDPYSLSNNKVHAILSDSRGRLWVGTFGGGLCLLDRSGDTVRFLSQRNRFRDRLPAECNKVRTLCEDAEGRIWAGTSEGILLLDYDEAAGCIGVESIRRNPDDPKTLLNNDIVNIYRDLSNRIWVGSHGGGLARYTGRDPRTGAAQWSSYIENNGHIYSDIRSISGNVDGSLWVATDLQLCTFYPETGQLIPLTQQEGILATREFQENAAAHDRAGRTYIAEANAIYYSEPQRIADRPDSLHLRITGFEIDGQLVKPSAASDAPLRTTITSASEVRIGSSNHTFGFTFAAMNRHRQQHIQYLYRLEGYDREWLDDNGTCEVRYANVPGGRYRFRVRAYRPQSPEAVDEVVLDCYIASSFWSSWRGALLGFAALTLMVLLGLSYRNIYRRALANRRALHISSDQIAVNDTQDEDFMRTVVDYLEQHYSESALKIEDLARQTHMSRSSFYNHIKELTQMTPNEYLKHFRLRKAEAYLTETQLPIAEIAYRTGFTEPAYFTMCFRTRYGVTPSVYRKRNPPRS